MLALKGTRLQQQNILWMRQFSASQGARTPMLWESGRTKMLLYDN